MCCKSCTSCRPETQSKKRPVPVKWTTRCSDCLNRRRPSSDALLTSRKTQSEAWPTSNRGNASDKNTTLKAHKRCQALGASSESSCSASASGSAEGSVAALADTHSQSDFCVAGRSCKKSASWMPMGILPNHVLAHVQAQALVAAKKTYSRPRDTHLEDSWTARPSPWQTPGQSAPPRRCPWPWHREGFGGPSQCLGSRWPTCAASSPRGQGV